MTPIEAGTLVPEFSSDGGTTWKTLVCVDNWTFNGESSTSESVTFCGTYVAAGSNKSTGSASAMSETAPTVSQLSHKDALDFWHNKTALKFRATAGTAGADFYVEGDSTITSYTFKSEAQNVCFFDIAWTINNLIIEPA